MLLQATHVRKSFFGLRINFLRFHDAEIFCHNFG